MKTPEQINEIIEYGTKAPSGHNTQPWKFLVKENEIQIHPDFDRELPIVDPDNHALYISLGCAAENMLLAAKHFGYECTVNVVTNDKNISFIKLLLNQTGSVERDNLFDYINIRQSTRNLYTNDKVSSSNIAALQESFNFKGIEILMFTTAEEIEKLETFIIEGSNRQFQNKDFVKELVSWIRFSKKEVAQKRDGIWQGSMGMPGVGRTLGNIIMKKFVSASSEAKRWKKQIEASAGFALFTVEKNDVAHWVLLGRAFQRFGLTATQLNISHAHVNMPCEEIQVRNKMAKQFELTGHPLLLIRFGYSKKMPYSYRRPLADVLETP